MRSYWPADSSHYNNPTRALIAGLVTLAWASPAPQLDTIKDMFRDDYYGDAYGDAYEDAYHGDQQTGRLEDESNGVEVVKNEDGYVAPDDYQQTQGALTDKATSKVDNVFANSYDCEEDGINYVGRQPVTSSEQVT